MTGPIDFADITVGMQLTATTTWTATGASSATSETVVTVEQNVITLSNGDTIVAPEFTDPGTTVGFNLDQTAPTPPPPPPALGTIYLDGAGAAWQATGTHDALVMSGIDGSALDWPGFLDAHPDATPMQDVPVVPLPAPVSPYPQTIAPADARLGMDIRATVTYTTGEQTITRGLCPWVQDNPPPTDETPSFLFFPAIGGARLVASDAITDLVAATPSLQSQIEGRYVIQYDPIPDTITLLVEQMQDWTADSVWDISGIPEPPIGSVVRSRNGVAWQRTGDATQDGDWYLTGQGMWSSVTGDYPRSFLWLWGAAAPFNLQEEAP